MIKFLRSLPRVLLTFLVFCLSQHCWLVAHHCWEVDVANEAAEVSKPLAADHTDRDLPEPHQHGRGPILGFVSPSSLQEKLHPLPPGDEGVAIFFLAALAAHGRALEKFSDSAIEALFVQDLAPITRYVLACSRPQAPPILG